MAATNVTTAAAATVVAPQSPSPATITTTTTRPDKLSASLRVSSSVSSVTPVDGASSSTPSPPSNATSESTITTTSSSSAIPIKTTNRVSIKVSQQTKDSNSSTNRLTSAGGNDSGDKFVATSKVVISDKVSIGGTGVQEVPLPKISSAQFGLPSIPQKRKFSFPASLHANLLGLSSANNESITTNVSTRRRFSNVGDVVSRKLSNTIGWRTLPVPPQEVVAQGKALCCQYIRNRLKRSGIFNKKLGLYRLRSVVGTPSGMIVTEVYPSLVTAGQELERMHPKVFSNIARQASSTPAGVIVSDKAAATLLLAIGREIIKTDITWGKVVAVFAVAGGLAVDCVCQGHPEYLHGLVEGLVDLLEEELAEWIASNGGWTSLSAQCRTPTPEITTSAYLSIFGIFIAIVFVFYIVFKFCCRLYLL